VTTVDFIPFANDASSADVVTQAEYVAAASGSGYVQIGFSTGVARSNQFNKAMRQSSVMTAAIAQFIAAETAQNVLDSGGSASVTALTSQFLQALRLACLPNNANLSWDQTYNKLTVSGATYPHIVALNATGIAGIALQGVSGQRLIMHYGDDTNTFRIGRWAPDWQANPVRFDMDAPDGSLVVDGAGTLYLGSNKADAFPSGTPLLFPGISTAPVGWTKSTTHNDKMLRIVSGTAGSGGSAPLSTAWSSVALSGTVQSHGLTWDEMPYHSHSGSTGGQSADHHHSIPVTTSPYICNGSGANFAIVGTDQTGGSSNDHYHDFTTSHAGGDWGHSHGLAMNAFTITPAYVDAIICIKN
jgi:hypothetical protein